jgi:hypothetical protein
MSIFDIGGILNVQSKYLDDLAKNANSSGNVTPAIGNLQKYLNDLYDAYNKSNASAAAILTQQQNMASIVDNEKTRLDLKKTQIDQQLFAKQRMADLNDNYKKRQSYINSMFIVLIASLIIFIVLIKLKNIITIIPGFIFNLLIGINILGVIIYMILTSLEYNRRDRLNFDEIQLPPMNSNSDANQNIDSNINIGNLLELTSGCKEAECCVPGTEWNSGINKCVPSNPPSPNPDYIYNINNKAYISKSDCTSNSSTKTCGNVCIPSSDTCSSSSSGFSCMNGINTPAFSPNEFSNYSLYK